MDGRNKELEIDGIRTKEFRTGDRRRGAIWLCRDLWVSEILSVLVLGRRARVHRRVRAVSAAVSQPGGSVLQQLLPLK